MAAQLVTLAPLLLAGGVAQRIFSDAEISALDLNGHVVSVYFAAPAANGADDIFFGDSAVAANRGIRIPKGDFRTFLGDAAAAGGNGLIVLEGLYVVGTAAGNLVRVVTKRTY